MKMIISRLISNFFHTILVLGGSTYHYKRSIRKKSHHSSSLPGGTKLQYTQKRLHAKQQLTSQLKELSNKHGLPYNRVTIRDQRTRWGSCSAQKNISLNRRLSLMPQEIAEYIIIHELAHTVHMNHSKSFWLLVESLCPHTKQSIRRLKKHGGSLLTII